MSETLLSVQDLTKRFRMRRSLGEFVTRRPGESALAVDHVSFDLASEILVLAGGSGSGKTTLARMLIRLVEPDEGVIMVDVS